MCVRVSGNRGEDSAFEGELVDALQVGHRFREAKTGMFLRGFANSQIVESYLIGMSRGMDHGIDLPDVFRADIGCENPCGINDDGTSGVCYIRCDYRRGSLERQIAQSQRIIGTPWEVPVPRGQAKLRSVGLQSRNFHLANLESQLSTSSRMAAVLSLLRIKNLALVEDWNGNWAGLYRDHGETGAGKSSLSARSMLLGRGADKSSSHRRRSGAR